MFKKQSTDTASLEIKHQEQRYHSADLGISLEEISEGALLVCRILQQHGFDGYLVGGCVRDWMMGLHPKDFDVVTNAKPEQVRPLFKRARIIGRRFKLVHVYHKRELIEVATYRAPPTQASEHHKQSETGRVLRDNVYGNLSQDAQRRDFTINALYLNPLSSIVIDYTHGVDDLLNHRLALIGDTQSRFAEDPVRMLRALRFKAKLGFKLPNDLKQLISDNLPRFKEVSNIRLFDEMFKLFHHAHAIKSWNSLSKHKFIAVLLPLTAKQMSRHSQVESFILRALENTDQRVGQGKPVIPAFFFAVVLWHAYCQQRESMDDLPRGKAGVCLAADIIFRRQYPIIAIPKRVCAIIIDIWDLQWHLTARRVKSIEKLLINRRFRAAYDFLSLRQSINEVDLQLIQWWTHIQNVDDSHKRKLIGALNPDKPQYRRRRKRKE